MISYCVSPSRGGPCFFLIRQFRNRVAKWLQWTLYKPKAENAEKSSNHEFWRKMFCSVASTYTSPKVCVTASKQVLRKKRGYWGIKIWNMYQINLTFLGVRSVSHIRVYIFFLFWYFNFFSMCKNWLRGWLLERMTRYMRYLDDLPLTQLLVRRIGHPKKDILAE